MRRRDCRNGCRRASGRCRSYALVSESGDDHAKTFKVSCTLVDPALTAEGEGGSRRKAGTGRRRGLAGKTGYRQVSTDTPAESAHRSGSVAVIGRPNVGKSTLINALVGAKVSIVSNRPQTTRHRLLGIATFPEGQLALVDTPGLHKQEGKFSASAMSRVMNRAARGALEGVDAAMLVIEAGRWDEADTLAYNVLGDAGIPVMLVVNKVDRIKDKAALLPFLARITEGRDIRQRAPDLRAEAQRAGSAGTRHAGLAAAGATDVRRGRDHRPQPALHGRRTACASN